MSAGPAPGPSRPSPWERAELALVGLSAGGSLLLGLALALAPGRAAAAAGLAPAPAFLVRQVGVFYLVLATGFALEYRRGHGVVLLVTGQLLTALFLVASWFADGLQAQLVLFVAHAWLGAVTWAVHDLAQRQRFARVRLRVVGAGDEPVRPAGRR